MKRLLIILLFCSSLFAQNVVRRTYTSRTIDNGDGTRTLEKHINHIHYKFGGNFVPVDFTIVDMTTYWRMTKASYKLYIAKDFGSPHLIRYDNRYEGANHTIYFEPHSLQWVNKTNPADRVMISAAQPVTGVMDNDSHTITYPNAFGTDIDFVVELRNSGFRKYIRFNVKPILTPPGADYVPVLLQNYEANGLKIRAKDSVTDWDDNSYYESQEGFDLVETSGLKSVIKKAFIWDSGFKRQKLKLYWERRNNVLWLAKVLPKAFFADATYPVMADDSTGAIYSEAAGDGVVYRTDQASWAAARETAAGVAVNAAATTDQCNAGWEAGPLWHCIRLFFPFETGSDLAATDTITAANLELYCTEVADNDGGEVGLVQTKQASVSTLGTGDFDECGESAANGWSSSTDTDIIEGMTTRLDLTTGITTSAYNTFALNATGLTWIARNGETKPSGGPSAGYTLLGVREATMDLDNVAPANGPNRAIFRMADFADVTSDPKLTVTFTPANTLTTYYYMSGNN